MRAAGARVVVVTEAAATAAVVKEAVAREGVRVAEKMNGAARAAEVTEEAVKEAVAMVVWVARWVAQAVRAGAVAAVTVAAHGRQTDATSPRLPRALRGVPGMPHLHPAQRDQRKQHLPLPSLHTLLDFEPLQSLPVVMSGGRDLFFWFEGQFAGV